MLRRMQSSLLVLDGLHPWELHVQALHLMQLLGVQEPTRRLDAGTQLNPRAVVVLQLQRPPHRHQGLQGSRSRVEGHGQ